VPNARHSIPNLRLPAAGWLLSPRGRLLLGGGLFVLAEVLTLPVLVYALVLLPYRGGPPAIRSAPELALACLAVAVGVPLVCSLFLLARLNQAASRLPPDRRPWEA
jgi:hypothetical protein